MVQSAFVRRVTSSFVILLFTSIAIMERISQTTSTGTIDGQDIDDIVWWKKTNFYHIYVRSFLDSNGDGNGDLRGIVMKLDYLKSIGVQTLLLSPFYSSPMKDGGYDIDDYYQVNPMFGTMQDFELLVKSARERQMRVVVDFVPNHTSNKHKWFQCSERALIDPENCGKFKDYYVWSSSTRFEGRVPTNWISALGGDSAWAWSEVRKEFYLHQFLPEQPDLNLRNPLVRDELKQVARFWFRKGASGIRCDAVIHMLEDTINWPDDPENPNWRAGDDPFQRLTHLHTLALPESAALVRDWREVADEEEFRDEPKVILTEAYESIEKLIEYYGPSPGWRYADLPFNFELLHLNEHNLEPDNVEKSIFGWLKATIDLHWPHDSGAISPWTCWVTGNHDGPRLASRVGANQADAFKWITYLLPGVPVLYCGDELGMPNANFSSIPERTLKEGDTSRLIYRAPIAWTAEEPAAGFSSTADTWMPVDADYKVKNVETMLADTGKNALKNFIRVQDIRSSHSETLTFGDLVFLKNSLPENDNREASKLFAMARTHSKFGNLLILANFNADQLEEVRLAEAISKFQKELVKPPKSIKIIALNFVAQDLPNLFEGAEIQSDTLRLAPNQVLIAGFTRDEFN